MTPYEIRKRLLHYEELYPEFPHLDLAAEVELIYGGGQALVAWENYTSLKDLLEVSR